MDTENAGKDKPQGFYAFLVSVLSDNSERTKENTCRSVQDMGRREALVVAPRCFGPRLKQFPLSSSRAACFVQGVQKFRTFGSSRLSQNP